jgi:hypothetical protein
MGKVILEFDSTEDQSEINFALNGYKWYLAVWDMDQYLREQIKYNQNLTEDQYKVLEEAREKLSEIKSDYNLSFED